MTDNVTVRIGANASQAIREIGRVRTAASSLKSMAFGVGGFFGFAGMGAVYKLFEPMRQGIQDAIAANLEFTNTMKDLTTVLQDVGDIIAAPFIAMFAGSQATGTRTGTMRELRAANKLLETTGTPYGPITAAQQAQFDAGLAERQAMNVVVVPDSKTSKIQEDMRDLLSQSAASLKIMELDMAKTTMLDPW